jgi:hypothetical protein
VTFVDLPKVGKSFAAGEVFGTVESVKAASDLYCPVAAEIVEANAGSTTRRPRESRTVRWRLDDPREAEESRRSRPAPDAAAYSATL